MVMTSTIQKVLRPFFIMCFIIGLGIYPTKQSKPQIQRIIFLSILYSLTIWCTYGYLLYYTITRFTLREFYWSVISATVFKVNIIITITSVIRSFSYQKRLQICMKKLTAVDDTLEKLGTPKMYRKMHILSKQVVAGWIVFSLAINIYETILWSYKKETSFWGLVISHILNHCVHINTFVDLLFIILLWHIGIRFDNINEHIECLVVKEDHEVICTWKKPVVTFLHQYIWNYKQTLWTSIHLHLELCRIARELNLIFGMQMTFEMAAQVLHMTALCYYLYLMWEYQIKMSINDLNLHPEIIILRASIYFIRFCTINLMCEYVSNKANKIIIIIHQLTNIRYADVLREVCQFALQIVKHPLRFNGMDLFCFGNVFLQKFFTTVLTFVIITVQMKMYVRS